MNDDDVTPVTRNRSIPPEVKLAIDLLTSAAIIYYVTHPDCLDQLKGATLRHWSRVMHHLSVWTARQDIRSLPETDEH